MPRNVLFVTVDQWRGDCLSAAGHPVVETPALDRLAGRGVLFANHWANAAPCGPSRACLYTGTYLHHNRSIHNGTPLDDRFTNVARLARTAGYDPVLFGYTDTSADPRTVAPDDEALRTYEGVLPGFRPVLCDRWEEGSPAWGRWLARQGVDVPANPHDLYRAAPGYPVGDDHGESWAPARFNAEQSQTCFILGALTRWLERHGDQPFFAHASLIRPHPPRRNPPGYHDLFRAEQVGPFVAAPTREEERSLHPFNAGAMAVPGVAAPDDELERRQLRATYYGAIREVDDRLGELFTFLEGAGLAASTLVVVTSDHGEMGGDHWLLEKLGYWDEAYRVPLIVADPSAAADGGRGTVIDSFTESVDVLPTICEWLGVESPPQLDGWSLAPFLRGEHPAQWRRAAHFEWSFSDPRHGLAESYFSVPSSHCSLAVLRSAATKYVQFAADDEVLPPLLFDLRADPWQLHDTSREPGGGEAAGRAAAQLLRWRMRNDAGELAGQLLDPELGLVTAVREKWR